MIKLIQTKQYNLYQVQWLEAGVRDTGTKDEAVESLRACDVEDDEIEYAFSLLEEGPESVNFGVNKTVTNTQVSDEDQEDAA